MSEFKVGDRVRRKRETHEGVVLAVAIGGWVWVDFKEEEAMEPYSIHRSNLILIPDTVTIEVSRQDAEWLLASVAAEWVGSRPRRIEAAARAALEAEKGDSSE